MEACRRQEEHGSGRQEGREKEEECGAEAAAGAFQVESMTGRGSCIELPLLEPCFRLAAPCRELLLESLEVVSDLAPIDAFALHCSPA